MSNSVWHVLILAIALRRKIERMSKLALTRSSVELRAALAGKYDSEPVG